MRSILCLMAIFALALLAGTSVAEVVLHASANSSNFTFPPSNWTFAPANSSNFTFPPSNWTFAPANNSNFTFPPSNRSNSSVTPTNVVPAVPSVCAAFSSQLRCVAVAQCQWSQGRCVSMKQEESRKESSVADGSNSAAARGAAVSDAHSVSATTMAAAVGGVAVAAVIAVVAVVVVVNREAPERVGMSEGDDAEPLTVYSEHCNADAAV